MLSFNDIAWSGILCNFCTYPDECHLTSCEGSYCNEAYQAYLDEGEEEDV